MKSLLICPAERAEVSALSEKTPLVTVRIFGNPFLHYWLENLSARGIKEVKILTADRPEQIRKFVGNGARWGLCAEVVPESHELTCAEALARHAETFSDTNGEIEVTLIDHLPGFENEKLFSGYANFFSAIQRWFSKNPATRIGIKEIKPGIWAGLRAQISPDAVLNAPCWIGENAIIKPGAELGPMAFVENGVVIENGANVSNSWIASNTLVGEFTQVRKSFVIANSLVNFQWNSVVKISDAFLLCALEERNSSGKTGNLFGRTAALGVLGVTLPFALISMWNARRNGQRALRPRRAATPFSDERNSSIIYYELTAAHSWWKRWPQLWNVARGDFAWIGNRPLTPIEAGKLNNEFERLWLASPIGLISQGDAEGCAELSSDEAHAHASFYSAQANWRLDLQIFLRALKRLATRTIAVPTTEESDEIKEPPFTFAAR